MTPSTLKFLFGVHNHQPVGNFDHVFEQLFERCYRPYFEVLESFDSLKTAAHFSGPLWEWIESRHPDYFDHLRRLVSQGRLELLGGGFYEPLLATLPERDALGQLEMMNVYLEEKFGRRPRGLWLAERVWSPALPRLIAQSGLEFTVLDDTHFFYAGLEESALHGYYITEYQGSVLKLFPIWKPLRYSIPFELPEKTLERLRRARKDFHCRALTYADDGEKFGGWPDTWDWVYGQGYLKRWFHALEANRDWLETVHFSEFLDGHPPTGRVYLPPASYEEMMEWALPPESARELHTLKSRLGAVGIAEDRIKRFVRGGQWENFLVKYSESNQMHKRMLGVSEQVARLAPQQPEAAAARRALYRAQCNCAYWHGLFGGLYLNYLRHAVFSNLIEAETLARQGLGAGGMERGFYDFDLDGQREVVVSHPSLWVEIAPHRGGAVVELDYRPACFNLTNVLKRREESYHRELREQAPAAAQESGGPHSIHDRPRSTPPGLEADLIYDRFDRFCIQEFFVSEPVSPERLRRGQWQDQGDFAGRPFQLDLHPKLPGDLTLWREGVAGPHNQPVRLTKHLVIADQAARLTVDYRLEHLGELPLAGHLAVEFNVTLLAGEAPDRYFISPEGHLENPRVGGEGEAGPLQAWAMRDDWAGFEVRWGFSTPARLTWYPIETISQSEEGLEKNYQGTCLWFLWDLALKPATEACWTLNWEIIRPS